MTAELFKDIATIALVLSSMLLLILACMDVFDRYNDDNK